MQILRFFSQTALIFFLKKLASPVDGFRLPLTHFVPVFLLKPFHIKIHLKSIEIKRDIGMKLIDIFDDYVLVSSHLFLKCI